MAVIRKARRLAMKRQAKADSDQIKAGKYAVIMNSGCALEGRKSMLTRKCDDRNGRLGFCLAVTGQAPVFQPFLRLQAAAGL